MQVPPVFELDQRLAKDSIWVLDLALSQLRLMQDARFFWALLVPRISHAHEWFALSSSDQLLLHQETMQVGRALKTAAGAEKINIGALGNVIAQLHVHVIARSADDACWPAPVWGTPMQAASANLMQQRSLQLITAMRLAPSALHNK